MNILRLWHGMDLNTGFGNQHPRNHNNSHKDKILLEALLTVNITVHRFLSVEISWAKCHVDHDGDDTGGRYHACGVIGEDIGADLVVAFHVFDYPFLRPFNVDHNAHVPRKCK
jgi:hypothetical protein